LEILAILLFLVLLPLPGAVLWMRFAKLDRTAEDRIDALALGMAASLCILYASALVSLQFFGWLWPLAAIISIAVLRRTGIARPGWPGETRLLSAILVLYLVLRLLPTFFQEYPHGWDPYFHLVLADKISQAQGMVFDWTPYETTRLNYPLGSHLLLALGALATGAPPHKVFVVAVPFFTALTATQIYVLAWRAAADRELALYAAAAYAFMAVLGSLDYLRWGGLPNLIGMYLFVALLCVLAQQDRRGWGARAAFATLFVGLSLVHHHAMLAAGISLGWMLLYFLAKREIASASPVLQGLAFSAVLGAPYFVWYLVRAPSVAETGILPYTEKMATPESLMSDIGPIFFFAVLFGILLYLLRRPRQPLSPVLLQALVGLLLCYVLLEYGSRLASRYLLGREIAPFTPSRFITDAVVLLSVFAGLFLRQIKAAIGRSARFMLSLIVASLAFNFTAYARAFEPVIAPEKLAGFVWLREHARPDALVFDPSFAASYLTRRASSHMPYPASEPQTTASVRRLVAEIVAANGRIPRAAGQRQIIYLYSGDPNAFPASQILWKHRSGLMAVQLNPVGDGGAK
jgi:hypothetical protein